MIIKDPKNLISFWTSHADKRQAAGISRDSYCLSNDLKVHQMSYWERRLKTLEAKQQKKSHRPSSNAFVKANIQEKKASSAPMQGRTHPQPFSLFLGGGLAIELNNQADPVWVARLVKAMKETYLEKHA